MRHPCGGRRFPGPGHRELRGSRLVQPRACQRLPSVPLGDGGITGKVGVATELQFGTDLLVQVAGKTRRVHSFPCLGLAITQTGRAGCRRRYAGKRLRQTSRLLVI